MTNALVTCIIPVYNGERYLGEALESILNQTYGPLEVIVVDDGSTDRTPDVVTSYGSRVAYRRQANAGAPSARNLGIGAASGEWIAFLDADDLWHPEKLSKQLAFQKAGLDFSVTLIQNFWIPELAREAELFRDHPRGRPLPGYVTGTLLAGRSAFERVGSFDGGVRHADSADWFVRARKAGLTGGLLEEVLVRRRIHEGNVSRQRAEQSRDEFLALLKRKVDARRDGNRDG
jgi:glycosyltransferase involved in cell wall biosynthesis